MTEEPFGRGDPVIRRLQHAFAREEPATELAGILHRAARYQAGGAPHADDQLAPDRGLTEADLVAARQRQPAAVTRIYTAYAPALLRFFMAAVGNRQDARELTGGVFVSALEGLPSFRGPVQALGGWLFRIARHDLDDHRRRQARAPQIAPLDDHLDEAAIANGADELPGHPPGTRTVLRAVRGCWTAGAPFPSRCCPSCRAGCATLATGSPIHPCGCRRGNGRSSGCWAAAGASPRLAVSSTSARTPSASTSRTSG
jgi:Sigma-70 region 2